MRAVCSKYSPIAKVDFIANEWQAIGPLLERWTLRSERDIP